jgi:hypothetical protein
MQKHPMWESDMLRPIIAVAAAAFLTLTLAASEATARPGGGGFRGGGFARGGFAGSGFRGAWGPGFRGGFRHFGPRVAFGSAFLYGAYAGYPYYYAGYDGCLAPRRIWTPYGWRIRWVNVCY